MYEIENNKILLTTKEACLYTNINRTLLDTFRRSGVIKAIKIGRQFLYPIQELNAFVDRNIGKEITKDGLIIGEC